MKASTLTNSKGYLPTTSKEYLRAAKQWFFKTPERALNQAYKATLTIKAIEDEYFNGNKISADSTAHSDNVMSYLQAELEKQLSIARRRLAEFHASNSVVGISNSVILGKLRLIDEVIEKYTVKPKLPSSALVPVAPPRQSSSLPATSQVHFSHNVEVTNVESVSDKVGFLPRSIGRTINRVTRDLDPKGEAEVVNKYRSSRTKTTRAVRFLLVLVLVPLLTQQVSKHFLINPIVDQIRPENESKIFLNYELKEEALQELQSFEEELKLESLIFNTPQLTPEAVEERVKYKAAELAEEYHFRGNSAISNVFADLLALVAFGLVVVTNKKGIATVKSFMDDIVYGLSDTAKAFILILLTDLFVGFHSPHGWEVILEGLSIHLGLPANKSLISLFIATVPVIMDTIFKYWIFRYMSSIAPSALATMKNMNE